MPKTQYLDEYTREFIPRDLAKAAIIDEFDVVNQVVWGRAGRRRMWREKRVPTWPGHAGFNNNGDNANYDVRAKLVACEVATKQIDDYVAATPSRSQTATHE